MLSKRELLYKKDPTRITAYTESEKLEDACWNGMFKEWFPELVQKSSGRNSLYIWQIYTAKFLLCIQLAEQPSEMDLFYSIDPYVILKVLNDN